MNSSPSNPFSATADAECKCCGAKALRVQRSSVSTHSFAATKEQKTFQCGLCGDGWVSTLKSAPDSTFGRWLHTPGWEPVLVRTIALDFSPDNLMMEVGDEEWDYYLGDSEVSQGDWFFILEDRRRSMKARLAN